MHRRTWAVTWQFLVFACLAAFAKQEGRRPLKSSVTGASGVKVSAPRKATVPRQDGVPLTAQRRNKATRRRATMRLIWTGIDAREVDLASIEAQRHVKEVHEDAPKELSTFAIPKELKKARWLIALAGVSIGVLVYGFLMCFCRRSAKLSSLAEESGLLQASMSEGGLEIQGLVQVRPVFFGGAFFKQFSWCPEADVGRSLRIHDVQGRQVALASGALIGSALSATEVGDSGEDDYKGELSLLVGPKVWALLRHNQDVDMNQASVARARWQSFQVLTAQGTLYAEVKLLSDAKCIVEGPPPLRRRLMTVVGNFCANGFLCGDRNIHVWIAQAGTERTLVGAQCETRSENLRTSAGSRRVRSYFVSTTEHADTPLVMAVMLGLQEIHTLTALSQRQYTVPEEGEDVGREDQNLSA